MVGRVNCLGEWDGMFHGAEKLVFDTLLGHGSECWAKVCDQERLSAHSSEDKSGVNPNLR